jgi:hypothetical protein
VFIQIVKGERTVDENIKARDRPRHHSPAEDTRRHVRRRQGGLGSLALFSKTTSCKGPGDVYCTVSSQTNSYEENNKRKKAKQNIVGSR